MKFPGPRDIGDRVDQETSRLQFLEQRHLSDLARQTVQALQILRIRVQQRFAELARHTQQLVAMFVADADGERHRYDAAAERGAEAVEKLFIVVQKNDQLVAALRAHGLQVVQYADGARINLREAHAALGIFAVHIGDRAIGFAVALEHLDQGRWRHLSSTVIMRLVRGRKLICASSSMGSFPARDNRKRRTMCCTWTNISNIARFSPMQWRGPTAKGI